MQKILNFIALEILFWFAIPIVFLAIYVTQFNQSLMVISHHLFAITLLSSFTILLKALFFRFLNNKTLATCLSSILYSSLIYSLLIYYCLVLMGLSAWGQVISEELITSYAFQAPQFFDAIGFPYWLAIMLLILGYILITFICYFCLTNLLTTYTLSIKQVSKAVINFMLISAIILNIYALYDYFSHDTSYTKEPFILTLFSGKPNASLPNGSHRVPFNSALNIQEQQAISEYNISTYAKRKNVVLIVVDALRPDHTNIYGYSRKNTPYLSELYQNKLISKASNVRATCGETSCGMSNLLSSKFSHQLPNNPFTLPQVLQKHGYKVYMVLGGNHTQFYNLRDLYGKVDLFYDGSMAKGYYMNDDRFVTHQVELLPEWDNNPTMIELHLMSAHTIGKHLKEFEIYSPHKSYAGNSVGSSKIEYTNHYDNGVLQADFMIKSLLQTLEKKNYLKDALVLITADHGEGLGENNLLSHANSVREELLKIPLISIGKYDSTPINIETSNFISQVDIAPTILNHLQMNIPNSWKGTPVQNKSIQKPIDFSYFQLGSNVGLYDNRNPNQLLKYWINVKTGEEFAFNLNQDPKEQNNIHWQISKPLKAEWRKLALATQLH